MFAALCLPQVGWTQGLAFPSNAEMTLEQTEGLSTYAVPVEPFADGILPAIALEGAITRQAWRVDAPGLSTLEILGPLRDQLIAQGYTPLLECETEACGGFDFRFGTPVLRPPEMYVDLGDFRFLSAIRPVEGSAVQQAVTLFVSRSPYAGFVQLIRVDPEGTAPQEAAPQTAPVRAASAVPQGGFAATLEAEGHVVLLDLAFETGSSLLGPGPYQSLIALAEYLRSNPDRTVALVGHTDAEGSLDGNIVLSRRRAGSVLERLVADYAIPRGQMEAQGMGYLAPVSSNLTPEGRDANRRVEVIVTSTPE